MTFIESQTLSWDRRGDRRRVRSYSRSILGFPLLTSLILFPLYSPLYAGVFLLEGWLLCWGIQNGLLARRLRRDLISGREAQQLSGEASFLAGQEGRSPLACLLPRGLYRLLRSPTYITENFRIILARECALGAGAGKGACCIVRS